MLASRIRVSAIAALVTLGAAALAFGEGADASGAVEEGQHQHRLGRGARLPAAHRREVAERIVERRKEKPFARPEELMEVKGIGEKLFLSLKPYLSVTGPDHPRLQDSALVVSFGGPRFLPGAGREGEARQRRPRGQGTVTSAPARGPQGPGPLSPSSGLTAVRADREPDDRGVPGLARRSRNFFSARVGVDPQRGPRDDRGVLSRALVRDLPGPQRRAEVPQERRPLRVGALRRRQREWRPHGGDRERRRPLPRDCLSLVPQRRAARHHDRHPRARSEQPGPLPRSDRRSDPIQQLRHLLLLAGGRQRRRAPSTSGTRTIGWPSCGSSARRRRSGRSTTGGEREAGHHDHSDRARERGRGTRRWPPDRIARDPRKGSRSSEAIPAPRARASSGGPRKLPGRPRSTCERWSNRKPSSWRLRRRASSGPGWPTPWSGTPCRSA